MYERRRALRRARQLFFLVSFVVILVLAGIITLLIEMFLLDEQPADSAEISATSSAPISEESATPQDSTAQEVQETPQAPESTQDSGTVQTITQPLNTQAVSGVLAPYKSEELLYTVPNASIMSLAANGSVSADYFTNVTFVGDSLLQNLKLHYGEVYTAQYLAYYDVNPEDFINGNVNTMDGISVNGIENIKQNATKNVYIQLGADSVEYMKDEDFINFYEQFVILLKSELSQDTEFYLQSIAPVTLEKSQQSEDFTNERIKRLNDELALIAYKHDLNYLDIFSALADEGGNLRTDFTSGNGGVQLNEAGSAAWMGYIITHTSYTSAGRIY